MRRWLWGILVGFVAFSCAKEADVQPIKPPGESFRGELPPLSDHQRRLAQALRGHVEKLAGDIGERNMFTIDALNRAAEYIISSLRDMGYEVRTQEYALRGQTVRNIEATLAGGARKDQIIVVGAHYDTVPGCPGANDNGSGVAAVLEMARTMKDTRPQRTIRWVFFVNEEPPYFQTDTMGSMVYAAECKRRGDEIVAMISMETIGCYSDAPGSQRYPPPFDQFFPDTGNFIAFVANPESKPLLFEVVESFRRHARFPSEGGAAPADVPGIGWSDHWSFWQHGYAALMVTDTAPFRYPHYHAPTDTPDKIDYHRSARVVAALCRVLSDLAGVGE